MNRAVKTELAVFERGAPGSPQRLFRAVYAMSRLNSLGKHAEHPGDTADDVLMRSVAYMRTHGYAEFEPERRSSC